MVVILNRKAGLKNDDTEDAVRAAFQTCGTTVEIRRARGAQDLQNFTAQDARQNEVIVAAGGDGTIGAIASAAVDASSVLGVLPLGTLNHFAKDLGIPLDLEGAARTIVSGRTVTVDVGEVNDRVFLNNSSLGIYPYVVHRREAQQTRFGRGKWHAFARAALHAFRRYPFLRLRLTVDGRQIERKTAFLFIGNNEYEFSGLGAGGRPCLNAGHLGLCLANRTGRLGILRLAVRALFGRLAQAKDFETFCVDEAIVESSRRRLLVATDGEVNRMATPLHYRVRRGALRVRVPALEPAAAAA